MLEPQKMQYYCVIYLYKSPGGLLIRSYRENWLWGEGCC